jgi:hypothetical protein
VELNKELMRETNERERLEKELKHGMEKQKQSML